MRLKVGLSRVKAMTVQMDPDDDTLASLWVVLPLALFGFVVAAGCWTLFAVAGVHLRAELELSSLQFGILLAVPMAVSALLAVPAGLAARKFGARNIMLFCLAGLALCMVFMLTADTYAGYLVVASGLGLAGGFYSAGLQFVTGHCEPRRLGLVLGIFGAGVTGAGFNYYLVPLFHKAFSWHGVPVAYLIVLLLVLALLMLLTSAEDSRAEPGSETSVRVLLRQLSHHRTWHLCAYFGLVAGSFFALALWLPDYLASQFELPVQTGASLAQWFVIPGALAQIVGGGLSDRFGSGRVISRSLLLCLVSLFVLSYPPMTLFIRGVDDTIRLEFALPLMMEGAFVVLLGVALGCAMGGLQRLVILGNRSVAAFVAGLLLVAASLVAFVLPVVFGAVNHWLGIRSAVFMILFLLLCSCLFLFSRDNREHERMSLLHPGI
ncbi:NNP family nitrate/nitrite transporter-like MFS transporter [Marinobacter pelagius]|uniref:NNP family nitrate/nitrite transporter-like MFS transporter n=2 Tax=Marinobacter pelagius TaxID=379482 RepID=A0A366GKG7_9GAMM|nr:NNP family nitrate/nitrite transporter-like MFS transporter [Marinobacter pelagius]